MSRRPVAAAVSFAVFLPDKYESRMKLLVRNMRADAPVSAGTEAPAADRGEVSESQIVSEIELLKSRDLLDKSVRQANLVQPEANSDSFEKDVERAVLNLEKDLQSRRSKKPTSLKSPIRQTRRKPPIRF